MRRTAIAFCLAAGFAAVIVAAPTPSRTIVSDLDPNKDQTWQWVQGETVHLDLTARIGAPRTAPRDLTGATCFGVLYLGTNNYLYSTGTVAVATNGTVAFTVAAADSLVAVTNAYEFSFFASGVTSSAYLGKANVSVLFAPDATAPRAALLAPFATNVIVSGNAKTNTIIRRGNVFYSWTVTE